MAEGTQTSASNLVLAVLCLGRDKLHVEMLYCEVHRKYEACLYSLRNFSNSWIKGSVNLNMLDHARSDVHLVAMSKLRVEVTKEKSTLLNSLTWLLCG